jgi:excisionase family DNA binding protein
MALSSILLQQMEGLTVEEKKLALSITEVARALSVSPWTIRRWIRLGRVKSIRLGRRVLVEPREMRRLVVFGRKAPRPTPRRGQ